MRHNTILFIATTLLTVAISTLILSKVSATNLDQCNANNPENCPNPTQICNQGNDVNNPHCITPTVTSNCTPSPIPCLLGEGPLLPDQHYCDTVSTVTLTPSPTAGASATLIPAPNTGNGGNGQAPNNPSDGRHDNNSSCQFDKNCKTPLAPPATGHGTE